MEDANPSPDASGGEPATDYIREYLDYLKKKLVPPPTVTIPDHEPEYFADAPTPGVPAPGVPKPSAPGRRKRTPHQVPPRLLAPDVERALVAAALQDACVFTLGLDPADLTDAGLRQVWQAGRALVRAGHPCDPVLLRDALLKAGGDAGAALLAELQALEVSASNAGQYAGRVHDLALRRRAYAGLQGVAESILSPGDEWAGQALIATNRLAKLTAPPPDPTARVTGWSAAELLAANFPEPQWTVPGLVPVGLTFLAGRPKIGKSWLALQIAIAEATGGRVFDRPVKQGPALYIALEDNGRRLRDRVTKLGMPPSAAIRFEIAWPRLTTGGLELIEQAVDRDGYKLVVVDTLGRALGRLDMDDYGETTAVLGALQELAISRDIAVLVLDHHRKGAQGVEDDPVDAIVGSTGKSGAADAILGISKQQGKAGARLRVRGRELEEADMVLRWDGQLCCWQYEATEEEIELMGRRGQVLGILQGAHPQALTLSDIARETQMQKQNVIPLVNDLVRDGHAVKVPKEGRDQPYRAVRSSS